MRAAASPVPTAVLVVPSTPVKPQPAAAASSALRGAGAGRRDVLAGGATLVAVVASPLWARAAADEEYVSETKEVIGKVRMTISMDKADPNVAAKYRREKALLGRPSFRDMYSALNAVFGHYISFGPTAPIPAKRRARILEEMDTAEMALDRGR